jgi:hypothetical protein
MEETVMILFDHSLQVTDFDPAEWDYEDCVGNWHIYRMITKPYWMKCREKAHKPKAAIGHFQSLDQIWGLYLDDNRHPPDDLILDTAEWRDKRQQLLDKFNNRGEQTPDKKSPRKRK